MKLPELIETCWNPEPDLNLRFDGIWIHVHAKSVLQKLNKTVRFGKLRKTK